jgi:hypothetical protein
LCVQCFGIGVLRRADRESSGLRDEGLNSRFPAQHTAGRHAAARRFEMTRSGWLVEALRWLPDQGETKIQVKTRIQVKTKIKPKPKFKSKTAFFEKHKRCGTPS